MWPFRKKSTSESAVSDKQKIMPDAVEIKYRIGFIHGCGNALYVNDENLLQPARLFCERCGTSTTWKKVVFRIVDTLRWLAFVARYVPRSVVISYKPYPLTRREDDSYTKEALSRSVRSVTGDDDDWVDYWSNDR